MNVKIVDKHPLAIRWFHWINFPVLFLMIWSGLLIYWSNDAYSFFGFHLFPNWFYAPPMPSWLPDFIPHSMSGDQRVFWILDHRLAEGMSWHFMFMWIFGINGALYVLFLIFSGQWRHLIPTLSSFKDALLVVLHDLHLIKQAPTQGKYNAAQKIAYTSVIVMGFGSLLTGLAIYKPMKVYELTRFFGGYDTTRVWHFVLTVGFVGFFFVHVGQVIKTGWNNFRAMVTGKELEPDETPDLSAQAPSTPALGVEA